MNPCFSSGLSAVPSANLTPTQANNSFVGGAPGLDPYGQYATTPSWPPQLDSSPQATISDTPQLYLDDNEKLDDVSTWNVQTIHQVAASLAQNVSDNPAYFDLEDQWPLASQDAWNDDEHENNNNNNNNGYGEEDVLGAYGNTAPLYAVPSGNGAPQPSTGATPRRRKLKMYEWPPQSDPELEKRRQRAVRQYQQRLKEEQMERSLRRQLEERQGEVATLTAEVHQRHQKVLMLKRLVAEKRAAQQRHMAHHRQTGGF
ncbi:dual specificity protein kinase shkE-like [Portunus trituberculatus]|uniref:dual specificity protein kinase shkE-like n=1 Tax=Portunus trituberculatus TaxID=210409 RepID=UPI001E1D14E0|nr:dual specificity protein kinase shkE-like [Portunus trituberculatus]